MRYEVGGLVIGDEGLCPIYGGEFTGYRVHACKDRCHRAAVVYDKIAASHPEYLSARRGTDLYLNIVDAPVPIFRSEVFTAALDFIDEAKRIGLPIGIHCNQGKSRAPSIALLWLAKRAKVLPDDSYDAAVMEYITRIDPWNYEPGQGIQTFLAGNWAALR